jgi:predicted MFS family arabinose efflux permease
VFAQYRAAFRAPGSPAFCAASFVARAPNAIYPLGLILLFSQARGGASGGGRFGVAGLLEGCYIIAGGVGNPLVSRLIDRFGQTRLLLPAALVHAASALALVLLYEVDVPDQVIVIPVMSLGLTYLPIGSLVRSRWSYVLAGRPELGTAYSIESTLDELIFTIGPIVAAVLTTLVDPLAGIGLGAVLVAAGSMWLRAQPGTDPPVIRQTDEVRRSALRHPGMVLLAVAMIGMGGSFGTVEVTVAAFASQHGARAQTGIVLAAFAIGSGLAGLAYGTRQWRTPLSLRFLVSSVVFMLLLPIMLLAGNVLTVGLLVGVVGFSIAPTLITGFGLVDKLVPARVLTEGLSWVGTGLNVGYGVGAAVAGVVADRHGAHLAFLTPIAAGLLLVAAAIGLRRRIADRAAVAVVGAAVRGGRGNGAVPGSPVG